MRGKSYALGIMPLFIMAASMPVQSVNGFISLDQLCAGSGDCVVTSSKTIVSASAPLRVNGNFTLSPGVVLVYEVPIQIEVMGNLVLSGTLGAPGNGGTGGDGGSGVGGAGGAAPPVVGGVFDVKGSITLDGTAAVAAEGGAGGNGGAGPSGGGEGGAGAAGGSLTFNTCSAFTSASGAQILANGGVGGNSGDGVAAGGAGGAGGTITINARQTIVSNATMQALGGDNGQPTVGQAANGTIALTAGSTITGSLSNAVTNQNQSSISALSFCAPTGWAGQTTSIPTLSEWAMLFLSSLIAVFAVRRLRRR